jgi:hypothetical protein
MASCTKSSLEMKQPSMDGGVKQGAAAECYLRADGKERAGYSVADEAPIFLVVFAVPAAAAGLVWWRFSRG